MRGHFLAMEFVEGTDLAKLVKQGGPLPVAQASEYIRQAALGLQHAHERGLVHRDVKPHNLIMSRRDGLIKLADLGLARLPRAVNEEATAALTSVAATTGTLTPANAVLIGTADYLAPEQALDFHAADIRADIYGLGCTFFYLLTGQPPFAAATMAEKLLKHQQVLPPRLESFRADVPPGLEAVLARMLAKQPKKRYQTPAEVAQAVAPFGREPATRLRLPARVSRKVIISAAAALALLGLLLYLVFRPGPGPGPGPGASRPDGQPSAASALRGLRALQSDPNQLRQAILDLRMRYPGTPEAREAAALLMQMPSPLDRLDREKIPTQLRADWQPRELVAVLGEPVPPKDKRDPKCYVALSPDGRWLARSGVAPAGQEALIHLWDAVKAEMHAPIRAHRESITSLAFAPDGQSLASASWDEAATVKLWSVPARQELMALRSDKNSSAMRLAFSPDGRTLVVGTATGQVRVWDVTTRNERTLIPGGGPVVRSVAVAPDGRMLAVANDTNTVQFLPTAKDARLEMDKLPVQQRVRVVKFSPDGQGFAVGGLESLQLWLVSPRKKQYEVKTAAEMLAFAPDGQTLAWSNGRKLCLSNAATGKEVYRWDFPGEDSVTDLAFACDGRHLVVALNNATVCILRLSSDPRP